MANYKLGDIVLVKFPFTDNVTFKKRPALMIRDTNDGDVIVCRITSKVYSSLFDIELKEWEKYGLKLPSVLRIHKIASLEKDLIEIKLGEIDDNIKSEITKIFDTLLQS
jgi:mRNA interferase MazF